MKKSKAILFPLLAAFTIATSVGCNNSDNNVTETQNTQFTITTKNSDLFAGSATELNGVTYDAGTTVRLVATASFGYSFLGWYDGDTLLTSETEYLLKLESNLELTAKWKMEFQTYALNTINMNSNAGDITVHEDSRIRENTNVTLRATPKESYKFIGWYEGDTLLSQDTTYTFTMNHNTVIQAKWESLSTFIINTINDNPEFGDITSFTNQKYYDGDLVVLNAEAKDGYTFIGWFIDDILINKSPSYSFKIYSDLTLTAKWAKTFVLSTVNEDTNCGTITTFTNQTFNENDEVTLEASPQTGYCFIGWYNGDTLVSSSSTYTFNIDSDLTLTAKWAKTFILSTVNEDTNCGTITTFTNQTFNENDEVTLEASPQTGYCFIGWYNGDTLVSTSPTFKFNINADLTLTAKWATSCTLTTVSEDNHGYVTPYSNKSFEIGSSVTLEASGYPGYLFDGWYSKDTLVSNSATYTFTIDSNLELTAKWKVNSNIAYRQDQFTFENDSLTFMTGIIDSNVTEIVIPEGTIGFYDDVFNFENNITSVTFPNTLEWSGGDTFAKNGEIDFYYDGDWFTFNKLERANADGMPYNHSGGNIYFLDENGSILHNGKRYSLQKDIILPEGINNLICGIFRGFNRVESLYIPASVTEFNGGFQFFNSSFKKIYYGGTQEAWNNINKDEENSNKALKDMTIYFYSEDTPSTDGNYWHYVDGIITIWE